MTSNGVNLTLNNMNENNNNNNNNNRNRTKNKKTEAKAETKTKNNYNIETERERTQALVQNTLRTLLENNKNKNTQVNITKKQVDKFFLQSQKRLIDERILIDVFRKDLEKGFEFIELSMLYKSTQFIKNQVGEEKIKFFFNITSDQWRKHIMSSTTMGFYNSKFTFEIRNAMLQIHLIFVPPPQFYQYYEIKYATWGFQAKNKDIQTLLDNIETKNVSDKTEDYILITPNKIEFKVMKYISNEIFKNDTRKIQEFMKKARYPRLLFDKSLLREKALNELVNTTYLTNYHSSTLKRIETFLKMVEILFRDTIDGREDERNIAKLIKVYSERSNNHVLKHHANYLNDLRRT